jgi:hypothetical protein
MSSRSPISIADALRAVTMLAAEGESRIRIIRQLGLDWVPACAPDAVMPQEYQAADRPPSEAAAQDQESVQGALPPTAPTDPPLFNEDAAFLLYPLPSEPIKLPAWIANPLPLSPRVRLTAETDPLFTPAWTRTLLSSALGTRDREGPFDMKAWVESLACLRPPDAPLRVVSRTLRRGVQVLCDRGESMQPFLDDQTSLIARIRQVVGPDRVDVSWFQDCPVRGCGGGSRRTWRAWSPPDPGTVILLLSDLGIARPSFSAFASTEEWAGFARAVQNHGCPLKAFVPYPPSRWPRMLMRSIHMIQWDRSTRPGVEMRRGANL